MRPVTDAQPKGSRILALLTGALLLTMATLAPVGTAVAASAPGAVTSVVGTAQNARVALSWSAPTSTGGARITELPRAVLHEQRSILVQRTVHQLDRHELRRDQPDQRAWLRVPGPGDEPGRKRPLVAQLRCCDAGGSTAGQPDADPDADSNPDPHSDNADTHTDTDSACSARALPVRRRSRPTSTPDPHWTQLESGAPTVGLAIINPNSGPGSRSTRTTATRWRPAGPRASS